MTTYWHMQMHPNDQEFAKDNTHTILENKKFIGLGTWKGGENAIDMFNHDIKVNDIVAIKDGGKLIALVQVIGGAYVVNDDESETKWIKNRRPIRVLDWEIDGKKLPHTQSTIMRCVNDVATTRMIKEWHERVNVVLKKRGLPLKV